MEKEFEQIRDKLADATPEALGFHPDRKQVWEAISRKQQIPRSSYLLWVSHAAAILTGILLGATLIALYFRNQPATDTIVVTTPQSPAAETAHEAELPSLPSQTTGASAVKKPLRKEVVPEAPAVAKEPQMPVIVERQPSAPVPTVAVAPPMKTIHISDISHEHNNSAIPERKTTVWERIFSDRHHPSDPAAQIPTLALHDYLTRSKNH